MLKRIASNVITRLAVIAILAALAFVFGTGKAHAQDIPPCTAGAAVKCDQGQAYALAEATARSHANCGSGAAITGIVVEPAGTNRYRYGLRCAGQANVNYYASTTFFDVTKTCNQRPEQTTWGAATAVCHQGCTYYGYTDGGNPIFSTCNDTDPSPTGVTCGTGSGATCLTTEHVPPAVDTDHDGVPDSEDAFPNDPKESADSDGDGVGDNADFSPEDPTDGQDGEGEEDGDDEGDNQASGGGTCAAPPTCSGDGIQCAQLFQQWQIRCQSSAQGKVTGDVQNCSAGITVTSPDAVANAQLLALRKIACKDGEPSGPGNAVGDANGNGVADVLEGAGTDPPSEEDDDVTRFGLGINTDMLDTENIFGGGQCPTVPSFPIMGTTISPSEFPYFCDFMAAARIIIPLLAAFQALSILMGRNS